MTYFATWFSLSLERVGYFNRFILEERLQDIVIYFSLSDFDHVVYSWRFSFKTKSCSRQIIAYKSVFTASTSSGWRGDTAQPLPDHNSPFIKRWVCTFPLNWNQWDEPQSTITSIKRPLIQLRGDPDQWALLILGTSMVQLFLIFHSRVKITESASFR